VLLEGKRGGGEAKGGNIGWKEGKKGSEVEGKKGGGRERKHR
jgi:hypothetical protein